MSNEPLGLIWHGLAISNQRIMSWIMEFKQQSYNSVVSVMASVRQTNTTFDLLDWFVEKPTTTKNLIERKESLSEVEFRDIRYQTTRSQYVKWRRRQRHLIRLLNKNKQTKVFEQHSTFVFCFFLQMLQSSCVWNSPSIERHSIRSKAYQKTLVPYCVTKNKTKITNITSKHRRCCLITGSSC